MGRRTAFPAPNKELSAKPKTISGSTAQPRGKGPLTEKAPYKSDANWSFGEHHWGRTEAATRRAGRRISEVATRRSEFAADMAGRVSRPCLYPYAVVEGIVSGDQLGLATLHDRQQTVLIVGSVVYAARHSATRQCSHSFRANR